MEAEVGFGSDDDETELDLTDAPEESDEEEPEAAEEHEVAVDPEGEE